jgi:hypothetical protein
MSQRGALLSLTCFCKIPTWAGRKPACLEGDLKLLPAVSERAALIQNLDDRRIFLMLLYKVS